MACMSAKADGIMVAHVLIHLSDLVWDGVPCTSMRVSDKGGILGVEA
jgi:hypothetical protein